MIFKRLLLICCYIIIFGSSNAQKKPDLKPQLCQIATIQRDSVLVKLKEYPAQVKMLEAYQKQLQSEYDFKKLELDTRLAEYQEKESTFSEEQKQEKIAELQRMNEELNAFSQSAEQKLMEKEQELLRPMNERIDKAIETVAQKKGYHQMVDRKMVYFSLSACDATREVITEANALR